MLWWGLTLRKYAGHSTPPDRLPLFSWLGTRASSNGLSSQRSTKLVLLTSRGRHRECSWGKAGVLTRSELGPQEHRSLLLPMASCRLFVSWCSELHANCGLLTMPWCGEVKHNWNSRAVLSKMTLKILIFSLAFSQCFLTSRVFILPSYYFPIPSSIFLPSRMKEKPFWGLLH